MKGWPIFAVGLGVFFFHFGGYWSATWWSKHTVLAIAFSIVFASWASWRTHWTYLPLMLWSLLNATVVAFQENHLPLASIFSMGVVQALEKNALYTLLTAVGAAWLFATITSTALKCMSAFFCLTWAVGTTAYLVIPNLPDNGWYFGNPSMGASLLACLLPSAWELSSELVYPAVPWALTIVAIYRTHTSIAIGILAVVTVVHWLGIWKARESARIEKRDFTPYTFLFLCGVGMTFVIEHALSGKNLLDTNGRSPIWQLMWNWTRAHHLLWTGTGAGSVEILTPILQVQYGVRLPDFFIWLHSDWLQTLIEFGWLGLAGALLAFLRLSWKASRRPACFASLMGFAALALFGYPLRAPIHAFCLLVLCCLIESEGKIPPTQAAS